MHEAEMEQNKTVGVSELKGLHTIRGQLFPNKDLIRGKGSPPVMTHAHRS